MTNSTIISNKVNYTFWELIEAYHISIPIIQRDYAQGREKQKSLREDFVTVLRNALLPNTNKLHLNFIYGKVLNERFVPLDGQQRLTTLFLLHWYLAKRLDAEKAVLQNFSYHTRPSSKDFCEALVNKSLNIVNNESISNEIQNTSWFFDYWKKDPTVEAMLNMLDTIQTIFEKDTKEDLNFYWDNLIKNNQIHFEFLNLEHHHLTDELYIKMNARGKELSDFENFKAWLMEHVENPKNKITINNKDWKNHLDITWADLFWNNKEKDEFTIDQAYMNFFRNMFQIFYVQSQNSAIYNKKVDARNPDEQRIINNIDHLVNDKKSNLTGNDFYKSLGILDKQRLDTLFKAIDLLSSNEDFIKIDKIDLDFFRNKDNSIFRNFVNNGATYPDKVRFYAMLQYLSQQNENFDKKAFISWMRIFRNLTINSNINLGNFHNILKSIDKIAEYSNEIYKHSKQIQELVGFDGTQITEELRKIRLINSETIKESNFLEFENHSYFKGQINFLLELSGENEEKFLEYGKKCAYLFKNEFDNSNFLLERAFLAKHNYLLNHGLNKDFLNIKEWKNAIFQTNHLYLFKDVLDDIENEKEIKEELEKIKDSYIDNDWRKLFIKYPSALKYCKRNRIRIYANIDEVRLLKGIVLGQNRGQNRELHSYCFYLKIKQKYKDETLPLYHLKYYTVSGNTIVPCAYLNAFTKTDHYNYAMDIYFVSGRYHIRFFNRNSSVIESSIKEKLEELAYHFTPKENCYFYENIDTMKEVEKILIGICSTITEFQI